MKVDCEGVVHLYVDVSVDAEQMADWPAWRITKLFTGLTKAIEAVGGEVRVRTDESPDASGHNGGDETASDEGGEREPADYDLPASKESRT